MPTPAEQPRFDQPVVDSGGLATQPWMNYWLRMASSLSQDDLTAVVAELQRRVDDLEDGQSLDFQILGQGSVSINGVPQPGNVVVITLEGDAVAPGNTQYYGTGPTGEKGWFPVSGAITVAAGELTKAVGADGVTTLGMADVPDSGAGVLLATTFDAKGRKTGSRPATITGTATQINVANGNASAGLPTLSLAAEVLTSLGKADTAVQEVRPGTNITVDNSDPRRPIVSATGGGAVTSVNSRTGVVSVPDFVQKATAPNSTDYGRSIIDGDRWFNTANGVDYTWVAGAWTYDNAASLSRYVPFYLQTGAASPIGLNADGTIPFYLADGTPSPIPTQA